MRAPPLSPVQLKQHGFNTLLVRAIPGGSLANLPSLEPVIRFEQTQGNPNEWRLWLILKLGSADPSRPFGYEVEMQIQALIEVSNNFPAGQKETMALVNGFSLLYSAAREMLLNITARSAYGPVSLPTLSFVTLVQEARKQRAQMQQPGTQSVPA